MASEVRAEFYLTSLEMTPDEMTKFLGILPTETWVIGDSVGRALLKRKENGWCLSTNDNTDLDLAKHVISLLDILVPKAEILREMSRKSHLEAEIDGVAYIDEEPPRIHFSQETLSKIVQLGAAVDIDIIMGGETTDFEGRAFFCLTGLEMTPDEITNFLGIRPTETWVIGDPIEGTFLKREENGWCLSTPLDTDLDLAKHVIPLLDQLLPKAEILREMSRKSHLEGRIRCVGVMKDQTPIITFEPEILSKIVQLGAILEIELTIEEVKTEEE